MGYQPFLISNYATGLDRELQPWLIPDDAQQELFDGYVYRGTMSKREGYNYLATGEKGGHPYTESRIVDAVPKEPVETAGNVIVQGNGTVGPYTFRLKNLPLRRGDVVITAGAQTVTDNGLGAFTGDGTGTVNYKTGDVTVTFNALVALSVQIYAAYDWFPGLPVMGIMNFITATNIKELIVADSKRLNKYDPNTNTLEYLGAVYSIVGITNANPGVITVAAPHNLSSGDKIFITGVEGMTQVNNLEFNITVITGTTFSIGVDTSNPPYGIATPNTGSFELLWQGKATQPTADFYSWVNYPDKDSNPRLLFTNNVGQIGYYAPHLTPSVGNYVNYPSAASPDFQMLSDSGSPITSITASKLVVAKDRLEMLRTTENGAVRPQRLRISGTGINCDNFLTSATGAGFIDTPDGTWIYGADFNRDDLLFFTEASTWVQKYTGDDAKPFVLQKIDESRGSESTFAVITYLNRTSAASPRGLIITDGYRVERQDRLIPDFSYNEIDGANFDLTFAGSVDENRDHYLIYPTPDQIESKRILTTNYEEDNYAIYRLPLSCMGNYINSFDITWNDLSIYPNWAAFGAAYGNWNSFAYTSGAPFSVGGGHKGEIWRLNVTESEDNPVRIRNITVIDSSTLEVTTDWNNYSLNAYDQSMGADYIFITGVQGMLEVNDDQYPIISVTDNNTFRIKVPAGTYSAYTSGGSAQRVIPFTALFKKFNPYANTDRKVRCGWLYMYVDSSGTSLTRKVKITGATQDSTCLITTLVAHNLNTGDQVSIFGVGGMTQLNNNYYTVTVLSPTSFFLDGIDSSAYTAYTSGGYVSIPLPAKIDIDIITNDRADPTQLSYPTQQPYQGNCTNMILEDDSKKWYKVYINQTGKFIQFRLKNTQAGAKINIQATMPGFMPVGRMI